MRNVCHHILLIIVTFLMAGDLAYAQSPAFDSGGFGGAKGRTHVSAHLASENPRPAPGEAITLAIVMTPEPGWHGYWVNPGDAGKALELDWALPEGAEVSALRYPVPETLVFGGLMNHVYEARYAVLTELRVPPNAVSGSLLPLRAKAHWLACTDSICVPEQADLSLDLVVGQQLGSAPANRTQFDDYRRALPRPLSGQALFETREDGAIFLSVPFPASAAMEEPHFFARNEGAKSYAAPQSFVREGDTLFIALREFPKLEAPLKGVLRIGPDQGVMIEAEAGAVDMPQGGQGAAIDGAGAGQFSARILLLSLAGAVVGGLILNIMPCVFPILSVKAMSLMRESASPAHTRAEAWAYTAGVMLTCMALGGAVLALRAAGTSVGWAFQLQSPLVILVLLALCLAIALNLAGLFRLSPVSLDGALATSPGLKGDFWSGILVAFVATPCTGPFMATALGTALVLPPLAAMAIFAGLGLGIALPFLLLAYVPALRNRLPRPGIWMEHVQRWLSVPMFLTAAALLWLLWRQAGAEGLGIGVIAALSVGCALWWLGNRQGSSGHSKAGWVASFACVAVLVGGITLLHMRAAPVSGAQGADNAFSEPALIQARTSGKPVFLYFTADWCLSCKVNEAGAIARDEVQAAFDRAGVQTLVGDWTNGDPDITRFLEAHGRSGVPLYLWYPASGGDPVELPQILTVSTLTDLVGEAQ